MLIMYQNISTTAYSINTAIRKFKYNETQAIMAILKLYSIDKGPFQMLDNRFLDRIGLFEIKVARSIWIFVYHLVFSPP